MFKEVSSMLPATFLSFVCLLYRIQSVLTENKLNLTFDQNDYQLIFERMEIKDYNRQYVQTASISSFKYNRTDVAVNTTFQFNIDIGNDLQVVIQTYKFASNEYRLFPLRFGGYICQFVKANSCGFGGFTKNGNFTGCSLQKNRVYKVYNFIPDGSKCPPYIPKGTYMVEMSWLYKSIELVITKTYGTVVYPEIKHKM